MLNPATPTAHARELFAEPTPLGLIGLAIGCAALTPIAFGHSLTPAGLKTAAMFCLLFGGGCQLIAGLLSFANKNLYGATLFTAFAFNWTMNWWALDSMAQGVVPDHAVVLAVDVASLITFVVITYGFGFYSKLLFLFLLDIDVLYAAKLVNALTGTQSLSAVVAVSTVLLGLIALWIAFAMLVNPVAGRAIFPVTGPMFTASVPRTFDFGPRRAIFDALYSHWQEHAFRPMGMAELERAAAIGANGRSLLPELAYLAEMGGVALTPDGVDGVPPTSVRLTAAGIDLYEQRVLDKHAA